MKTNHLSKPLSQFSWERVLIVTLAAALVLAGSALIIQSTRPGSAISPPRDWTCYSASSQEVCLVAFLPPRASLTLPRAGFLAVNFTTPASAQGHVNYSVTLPGPYQNISVAILSSSEYLAFSTSPASNMAGGVNIYNTTFFTMSFPWNASGSSSWVFVLFNPSPGSETVSFPTGAYLSF